jgi:hypothetical protein
MSKPWVKRALAWALFAAVAHSAAWAGYVHHLQGIDFRNLERQQAVIRWLDWTKFGPGMQSSQFYNLYLKMQPLAPPGADTQLVVRSNPRTQMVAYFNAHRAGEVVDAWIDRRSGRIVDIVPPATPDFWRLLRMLLSTLGVATFLIALMIFAGTRRSQPPTEN